MFVCYILITMVLYVDEKYGRGNIGILLLDYYSRAWRAESRGVHKHDTLRFLISMCNSLFAVYAISQTASSRAR